MPSDEEYYHWKSATFGSNYDIWHDGLNTSAVQSLTGEARENAVNMLRQGVELKDSHAAQALAAMGEVDVVHQLRAQLAQSSGESKVRVARAINAIQPDESLSTELIEVLEDGSLHWGIRIDAAIGLREFGNDISERALLRVVEHDGKYLVRYHASESLLQRWRVVPLTISSHDDIFKLICAPNDGPINADEQARLSEAVVLLKKLRK